MIRKKFSFGTFILFFVVAHLSGSLFAVPDITEGEQFLLKAIESPRSSAFVIFNADISGKIFIHDLENLLVVELSKPIGQEIELGLEEGQYTITNIVGGDVYESEMILKGGESVELRPEDLKKIKFFAPPPEEETSAPIRKEALLGDNIKTHFFGGIGTKSTSIDGEYAVLVGGSIGLTFNRSFSVGLAGYGRAVSENGALELDVDFDPGQPAYGGVTFSYAFFPDRKVHLRAGALFGSGNYYCRDFFIFEPEVDLVLNISRIARVRFGMSMPFTNKENVGLDNLIFNVGFQFGK